MINTIALLSALLTFITLFSFGMILFCNDVLIHWLGGYTQLDCLQKERNRLTYLYSESKRGRMVNKIHNELTNVTNQLLRMENND